MSIKLHTNYIALADILANGVVVLLILITLSLSTKQQDLEKELQQISEIGSVMSREIASSLITNALPSSAPAMLHDYNHPRKVNVPRLVLHKNHLFIEGAGDGKALNLRLSRGELLQQNNRFDAFLSKLTPQQKKRMRLDIIHSKNYYLLLSIIKRHKSRVLDWHFAGEENATGSGDYLLTENDGKAFDEHSFADNSLDENAELPPSSASEQGILTQAVDFFSGGLSDYGINNIDGKQGGMTDGGEIMNFGQGLGLSAQSIRDESERRMAKARGRRAENAHFVKSLKLNFAGSGEMANLDKNISYRSDKNAMPLSKQLLAILLGYMADKQRAYQAGKFVEISAEDFFSTYKALYQDYKTQIDSLYDGISALGDDTIALQHQQAEAAGVMFAVNQYLQAGTLITQKNINPEILDENKLSLKLYPQPTIDKGLRVDVSATDVILFANKHNKNTPFRWQLISILNSQLADIKIGFVFARYTPDGLLLSSQENHIGINQRAIEKYYVSTNQGNYWKWGLLIVILVIFLRLLYRRADVK